VGPNDQSFCFETSCIFRDQGRGKRIPYEEGGWRATFTAGGKGKNKKKRRRREQREYGTDDDIIGGGTRIGKGRAEPD
jgi:hypothetical protein